MDKKTLLGLVIIGVILFGFSIYNAKQAEKYNEKVAAEKARIDSLNRERQLETPNAFEAETLPQAADSASQTRVQVVDQARREHFGAMLYDASQAKEEFYTVENDLMVITFSNMGGRIASVELKDYKTYNQTPLVLFDAATSKFDLSFFIRSGFNNTQINTSGYGFTPVERDVAFTGDEQSKTFAMRLNVDSASYVEYLYTIYKDKYMIDFDVRFVGMKDIMSQNQGDLGIVWEKFPKFILGFVAASLVFSLLQTGGFFVPDARGKLVEPGVAKMFSTVFFSLAFVCIGLDTRLKDIVSRENRNILWSFLAAQSFNIVATFLIACLLFGVLKPLWA